jgi:SPASM domain peptide maturase of grasp-with-spasm system
MIKFAEWINEDVLKNLFMKFKRLKQVIVHSAKNNINKKVDLQTVYIFIKENINNETHCGNISPYYFRSNIDFFKESRTVNNCLNKKVCIDRKGYVKNCPSMKNNFGHINEITIADVIQSKNFQEMWNIKKDNIAVCKDCEFRYMCLDCRVYISDINNPFSKPQKCTYDPYTTTWC